MTIQVSVLDNFWSISISILIFLGGGACPDFTRPDLPQIHLDAPQKIGSSILMRGSKVRGNNLGEALVFRGNVQGLPGQCVDM